MRGETAQQAAARAAATVTTSIAEAADLRTASQLEPGMWVRAAGEWFQVERVTDAGDLILRGNGSPMFYAVGDTERFVWHRGEW